MVNNGLSIAFDVSEFFVWDWGDWLTLCSLCLMTHVMPTKSGHDAGLQAVGDRNLAGGSMPGPWLSSN